MAQERSLKDKFLKALKSNVELIDQKLAVLIWYISKVLPDCTVVLFGSRAQGRAKALSDVDIAVIVRDGNPEDIIYRVRNIRPRGLPLDVVVLYVGDLDSPLIRYMLRSCKVLYDGLNVGRQLIELGICAEQKG